jgi:hypothetical protein
MIACVKSTSGMVIGRGKPNNSEKNLSQFHLSTAKHMTCPWIGHRSYVHKSMDQKLEYRCYPRGVTSGQTWNSNMKTRGMQNFGGGNFLENGYLE